MLTECRSSLRLKGFRISLLLRPPTLTMPFCRNLWIPETQRQKKCTWYFYKTESWWDLHCPLQGPELLLKKIYKLRLEISAGQYNAPAKKDLCLQQMQHLPNHSNNVYNISDVNWHPCLPSRNWSRAWLVKHTTSIVPLPFSLQRSGLVNRARAILRPTWVLPEKMGETKWLTFQILKKIN